MFVFHLNWLWATVRRSTLIVMIIIFKFSFWLEAKVQRWVPPRKLTQRMKISGFCFTDLFEASWKLGRKRRANSLDYTLPCYYLALLPVGYGLQKAKIGLLRVGLAHQEFRINFLIWQIQIYERLISFYILWNIPLKFGNLHVYSKKCLYYVFFRFRIMKWVVQTLICSYYIRILHCFIYFNWSHLFLLYNHLQTFT